MNVIKLIAVWVVIFGAATALQKCCPQPENEHKCDCCPDACCCMCENTTGTVVPPTRAPPPGSTEFCTLQPLDVALIADSSWSIGFSRWPLFMQFMADMVELEPWGDVGGDDGTRFGFIKFNTFGHLVWSLMDPKSDSVGSLQTNFLAEPYDQGFTNTVEGLDLATTMLTNDDRDDAIYSDVAVLFADGLTNEPENFTTLLPIAIGKLLNATDLVFVVAIGDIIDAAGIEELQMITGRTDNASIFFVEEFGTLETQLPDMINAIVKRICDTVVFPTPTPVIPTTIPIESCKCCCPPLPKPKKKSCGCIGGGGDHDMDDD